MHKTKTNFHEKHNSKVLCRWKKYKTLQTCCAKGSKESCSFKEPVEECALEGISRQSLWLTIAQNWVFTVTALNGIFVTHSDELASLPLLGKCSRLMTIRTAPIKLIFYPASTSCPKCISTKMAKLPIFFDFSILSEEVDFGETRKTGKWQGRADFFDSSWVWSTKYRPI